MKVSLFLTLVLCTLFAVAPVSLVQAAPADSQIEQGVSKLTAGLGDIAGGLSTKEVKAKKDTTTLTIGGIVGLVAGGIASSFVNVEFVGIPVVPVVGALAGVYLANEGYFDTFRGGQH